MFMYKYNICLLPSIFESRFKFNKDVHSYNARQSAQIHIYIYMATIEMRMRSVRILEMFQHKTRIYYIFNNALHIYIKKYILHKDIDI